MRIRIGCAHPDRLLSYPDLHYLSGSSLPIRMLFTYPDVVYLSGCCLPIRIGALSGRRCPPDVRAGACGVAPRSITLFPPISHVIPRGLFQILKSRRCSSNVFSGYSKVTGLNYVRDLWGSMCDEVLEVLQWGRGGGGNETPGREAGALVWLIQKPGPMQSHRPRLASRKGKNQARSPLARASRISVRSLTSSETSAAGASSSAFLRRALRAFMGTTMQK